MTPAEESELTKLREIGWDVWDPIGLKSSDCPRDEYDPYLLRATAMLRSGSSIADVAAYLDHIAGEHMALGPSTSASTDAALRTANALRAHVRSSSDDA